MRRSRWRGSISPTATLTSLPTDAQQPDSSRALPETLSYQTCWRRPPACRVAVVTPYQDAVNLQLESFLNDGGIEIVRLDTFRAPDVMSLGRITAIEVQELARKTMGPDCDALFIACSQLPTRAILAGLASELGRPAWSSISATAWDAGRLPVAA